MLFQTNTFVAAHTEAAVELGEDALIVVFARIWCFRMGIDLQGI